MRHRHILLLAVALLFPAGSATADPARDAILTDLAVQAKQAYATFAGFSADRGAAFFRATQAGGDPKTPACAACHTDNPKLPGQNAKTGKPIEPMAVSANPARFTNKDDVEKWFRRNCKEVVGRECTPLEKGDFITFMASQ
jgi:mono/diheme cytochrome c family protein